MKDFYKMIIDNSTIEDGEKVFTFDHDVRLSASPRVEKPAQGRSGDSDEHQGAGSSEEEETEEEVSSPEHGTSHNTEGNIVRSWRILSMVQGWPSMGWWPTLVDYGHDGGKALKQMIPLINGKKPDLMRNHTDDVNAIIGHIENARWENSIDIPSGVNADLVIDPNWKKQDAYALQTNKYRSGSVGISGKFKKSHPDMEDYEFMQKQGKKVNGEIVRFLPVSITDVRHMAIVATHHGADPNSAPRDESSAASNSANNSQPSTGGSSMLEKLLVLFNSILPLLKLDKLIDNAEIPEGLAQKVMDRLNVLNKALERVTWLEGQLQNIGALFKADSEAGLTSDEVLNRLPEIVARAKNGDKFMEHRRKEAIKWYDSAVVDPSKKEMTDNQKKMRARIENSTDLEFIEEQLAFYEDIARGRFQLNRSSQPEDIDKPGASHANTSLLASEISDSCDKMYKRGEKK